MEPKFSDICLTVEEKPRKTSTSKTDPTGIEPGPAKSEATMLPLDHSGSQVSFKINIFKHSKEINVDIKKERKKERKRKKEKEKERKRKRKRKKEKKERKKEKERKEKKERKK